MKKLILLINITLLSTFLFAQNTKNVVYDANAQPRKVENFNSIEVSSAVLLYISQGKETAVAVSVDGNENIDKIKTVVKNGVLKIYVDNGMWNKWSWGDKKIKAYVTVSDINKIEASGASRVIIADKIKASDLKLQLSGASSLKGQIEANTLSLNLSGASSTTLNGTTTTLNIDASGASSIKAYDLMANTCNAEASGASSIRVNVTKEFTKIQASGASSIRYKGDAVVKNFEANGASSIKKDSK
ncbi:MAG: DUF2807 domain-containing protein [Bacteroidetes bacterium]|nr:DUF2807 domain-containing protein [Bacteroidota bacterium]MBS1648711.1 DUF2807 domain-containing protein [Bacteroidota bacterium]